MDVYPLLVDIIGLLKYHHSKLILKQNLPVTIALSICYQLEQYNLSLLFF